jgi:hypothetical protein
LAEAYLSEGDSQQALINFEKLARLALETGYKLVGEAADRRIKEIEKEVQA